MHHRGQSLSLQPEVLEMLAHMAIEKGDFEFIKQLHEMGARCKTVRLTSHLCSVEFYTLIHDMGGRLDEQSSPAPFRQAIDTHDFDFFDRIVADGYPLPQGILDFYMELRSFVRVANNRRRQMLRRLIGLGARLSPHTASLYRQSYDYELVMKVYDAIVAEQSRV